MKIEKGDVVHIRLDVYVRCLEYDFVEFDNEDFKEYLNNAVNLYKLEHNL